MRPGGRSVQGAGKLALRVQGGRGAYRFAAYEILRLAGLRTKAQRRAKQLLLTLLTPEQLAQYKRSGWRSFVVTGSAGGRYRIFPRFGHVERVERHGKRDWSRVGYCYHETDEAPRIPNADLAIAYLVLIQADEPRFLEEANARAVGWSMWNGEWRRRLNARRREDGNAA